MGFYCIWNIGDCTIFAKAFLKARHKAIHLFDLALQVERRVRSEINESTQTGMYTGGSVFIFQEAKLTTRRIYTLTLHSSHITTSTWCNFQKKPNPYESELQVVQTLK